MKRCLALLFVAAVLGMNISFGKSGLRPNPYLEKILSIEQVNRAQTIGRHIDKLRSKSTKRDVKFLAHVFQNTHRKFLKHFNASASFKTTIESGSYNCLTATTLYAIILEELGFNYRIVETNYHIFIVANTSSGDALLETTDGAYGFITNKRLIEDQIERYKNGTVTASKADKSYFRFQTQTFNELSIESLEGLLYFNLAVNAFNRHDLGSSVFYLEKSYASYSSGRSDEFASLLLLSLKQRAQSQQTLTLMSRIVSLRNSRFNVMAHR